VRWFVLAHPACCLQAVALTAEVGTLRQLLERKEAVLFKAKDCSKDARVAQASAEAQLMVSRQAQQGLHQQLAQLQVRLGWGVHRMGCAQTGVYGAGSCFISCSPQSVLLTAPAHRVDIYFAMYQLTSWCQACGS
jgi:hypothetical protein